MNWFQESQSNQSIIFFSSYEQEILWKPQADWIGLRFRLFLGYLSNQLVLRGHRHLCLKTR